MHYIRQISLAGLLVFGLSLLPACGDKKEEKKQGLVVVNVLDKSLYDDCHIKGSICVPFEDIEEYAINNFDKNAEIVLYCSNYYCSASGQACRQLKKLGFDNVSAYEGGTAEWYQEGFPVEGPSAKRYLSQKILQPKEQLSLSDVRVITMHQLAEKLKVAQ